MRIRASSSRAVLLDESAHVVQATVESLLAERAKSEPALGRRLPTPPGPSASELAAEPKPSARPELGLDLALLSGLHASGPDALAVPGAGVGLNFAHRASAVRPGAWFLAEYRFPFDIDDSGFPPQAQTLALRLVPSLDLARSSRVALQLGLGGGLDRFHITHAIEDREGHARRSNGTRVAGVFTGLLALRVGLVENVQFSALLAADFDPSPPDLEVRPRYPEQHRPWAVRPGLMLGISFTPIGAQPVP